MKRKMTKGIIIAALFIASMLMAVNAMHVQANDDTSYCGFQKSAELVCGSPDHDGKVEVGEDVQWVFTITVTNLYDWTMEDVVVSDRFAAELEIDCVCCVSHGTLDLSMKGNSDKVFLTWTIGDLAPLETATLCMIISTDENPAGHQEYTSPGCYELNSGAVLKFPKPGNNNGQYSFHTQSIYVHVYWPDN